MSVDSSSFHCEIEKAAASQDGNAVTTVKCHGTLNSAAAPHLRDQVKPLLPHGGRLVIDLADVNFLDSSGLGTLVALKASAMKQGYCRLEMINMTPRVLELFRITKLYDLITT
jgi:anti-sigma B factor antagonist